MRFPMVLTGMLQNIVIYAYDTVGIYQVQHIDFFLTPIS